MPNKPPTFQPFKLKSAKQRRAEHDQTRPNAYQRGYTGKWSKTRKAYLAKHPLCVHCEQLKGHPLFKAQGKPEKHS